VADDLSSEVPILVTEDREAGQTRENEEHSDKASDIDAAEHHAASEAAQGCQLGTNS
jgi:hypothetical protein